MNQREFASVMFAAVGVFIALFRLPELVSLALMLATWPGIREESGIGFGAMAGTFVGLVAVVLAGVALVVFRHRLAVRLFGDADGAIRVPEAQAVGLSLVGCYFAVQGAASLVAFGSLRWSGAVQMILGVALFLGARGVSRGWGRIRGSGGARGPGFDPTEEVPQATQGRSP